jgi:hypothetical protein
VSYSLAIWYSDLPMGTQEGQTFYHHLGWHWLVVRRRPEFDAFWQELLSRLPDLRPLGAPTRELDELPPHLLSTPDEIRERERLRCETKDIHLRPARLHPVPAIPRTSPWASSLWPMASAIRLAISGSYLKRTLPILFEMASRYGLIVYNPQEGQVTLPPSLQGPGDPLSVAVRLTLSVAIRRLFQSKASHDRSFKSGADRGMRRIPLGNSLGDWQTCFVDAMMDGVVSRLDE